jgi:hypothetical protein
MGKMKTKKIVLNSIIILLTSFIFSSCANAPIGYLNKDRYLYVDGDKEEVAVVFTEDLFCQLYSLPACRNNPVEFSITQLNYKYAGWKGVKFMEIRPGTHHAYLGMVGRGIPNASLIIEAYKVYILIWEEDNINLKDTVYQKEIGGARYLPERKVFVYQGREYKVP